ncbi:MAG: zinc-ribbon domain-containing protein [Betaproteobacteria bacterium]|nr:zinc-ribbon domain-containing protein [Betaproteobacteria bacterium]
MNELRRCHECGHPLGAKDVFCPRCGAKQRRERQQRASGACPCRASASRPSSPPSRC